MIVESQVPTARNRRSSQLLRKSLGPEGPSYSNGILMQRLDADFLEKDDVVFAVILKADVALVGACAVLRLEIEFALGDGLAFGEVRDFYAIELNDGVRSVQRDDHGVPFRTGLAGFRERLGERVERAGDVVVVLLGFFRLVIDLHFVTVVDGHPFFARLDGNADEDAGIVVVVAHFENDANAAVAEFAAGPVEEAHATVRADEAVLDSHTAGADVLPAGKIFAVEERLPGRGLRPRGGDKEKSRDGEQSGERERLSHRDDSSGKRGQARMPVPQLETQCVQIVVTDFYVVKSGFGLVVLDEIMFYAGLARSEERRVGK